MIFRSFVNPIMVLYPIHDKIEVNGDNAHPLYKFLKESHGFRGFDEDHP